MAEIGHEIGIFDPLDDVPECSAERTVTPSQRTLTFTSRRTEKRRHPAFRLNAGWMELRLEGICPNTQARRL